jgi:hypothetical protein
MVALLAVGATPTPPPQIYHIVTRPLCAELHEKIAPAIGMLLQNDATIKQSPALFKLYNDSALYGSDPANQKGNPPAGDPSGSANASQNLALLKMENLIRPIANNIIAIQTILDSPELQTGSGPAADQQRVHEIRDKLLMALAAQNASLDIISGFVDTQAMANLQHAGEAYIASMNTPDTTERLASPGPVNPLQSDPNYAGLPPNPYYIDPVTIPGLTLGYNPVTRLTGALHWTIDTTETRENDAAKAVMSSAALCSNALPTPVPSP